MNLPPTLPAYERAARDCLTPDVAAYLFGGAGAEETLRANRAAFEAVKLIPRVFSGRGPVSTTLFGNTYAAPILVAPVGYQRLFHPDGEVASARAAAALGLGYILPSLSTFPMEDVAAAMEASPHWFQLYFQQDRQATLALVRRAESCGARAIVLTLDAPVAGVRDRQIEAGFALPSGLTPPHPAERPQGSPEPLPPGWDAVTWLCDETSLPVIAKGIMHPDDAARAVDCGCQGIVVSNHGGRVLDGAIGALEALPSVVSRVGTDVPVLFDGGIRRGIDIAKALKLGAAAVLIGRPMICGLAVAGDRGAAHVLRLLAEEYALAAALT